jgi:protein-S-isoprenylcysteine O-methyltransferase Ste14
MNAYARMLRQGNLYFRYRSYIPIIIIIFALLCMWTQRHLYRWENTWFDLFCLLLALSGELIRIVAVGYSADRTSGRNTRQQVADEINTTGIYSLVRHPLYIGNFVIWLSIAIFSRILWLCLLFTLFYIVYYERIILAEEEFLRSKFGNAFDDYAARVNTLMPDFRQYKPNKYRFRLKKVIRKENSSLYGIIVVFFLIEMFQDYLSSYKMSLDKFWLATGLIFTAIYLIIKILKKFTAVLKGDTQQEKIPQEER